MIWVAIGAIPAAFFFGWFCRGLWDGGRVNSDPWDDLEI
jgi:hypothetical protein